MRRFVSLDLETSGLDPRQHQIIEVGMCGEGLEGNYFEDTFSLPFEEHWANPKALEVNGWGKRPFPEARGPDNAVGRIAEVLRDCHIVGKNPQFDVRFLEELFYETMVKPTWHHRLVDVGTLAWGWEVSADQLNGVTPIRSKPPSTDEVAKEVEIPRETIGGLEDHHQYHTALADARWAYKVFRHIVPKDS